MYICPQIYHTTEIVADVSTEYLTGLQLLDGSDIRVNNLISSSLSNRYMTEGAYGNIFSIQSIKSSPAKSESEIID